jgi:hypothetical protein
MDSFAFIIHPIDPKRDVSRKFPFLGRVLSERQIDFFPHFFRRFIFPRSKALRRKPQARLSKAGSLHVLIRRAV